MAGSAGNQKFIVNAPHSRIRRISLVQCSAYSAQPVSSNLFPRTSSILIPETVRHVASTALYLPTFPRIFDPLTFFSVRLKGVSHQFRFALKLYGWICLGGD